MKKTALISHGCAKNLVDSELMLGKLIQKGFPVTLDENEADIVIINTCSFINDAEKESVKSVFDMIKAGKKVIIAGCLPQKHKKELQELIPEASAFLGTSDIEKITDVIEDILNGESSEYEVNENPIYNYPENITRQQITMGCSSYIKIADGCDFKCGYCIIPQLRGPYKSRKIENIVLEAKELVKKGVNEIVLIAQDTTSYGKDLYGKPKLVELLKELNNLDDLIANIGKIGYLPEGAVACKYIHEICLHKNLNLPICSGIFRVLNKEVRPLTLLDELINMDKNR